MVWKARVDAIHENRNVWGFWWMEMADGKPLGQDRSVPITYHCRLCQVVLQLTGFSLSRSQLAAHHPVLRYIVAVFSRAQPPLTLSSPITNIRPTLFLPPCSTSWSFSLSLVHSASLSLCPLNLLAFSCSMASSPSRFRQNGTHARGAAVVKATALHEMLLLYVRFCVIIIYLREILPIDFDVASMFVINNPAQVEWIVPEHIHEPECHLYRCYYDILDRNTSFRTSSYFELMLH